MTKQALQVLQAFRQTEDGIVAEKPTARIAEAETPS